MFDDEKRSFIYCYFVPLDQNGLQLPVHSVLQVGRTVMVTSTGLDSFPPQSVATTDRT